MHRASYPPEFLSATGVQIESTRIGFASGRRPRGSAGRADCEPRSRGGTKGRRTGPPCSRRKLGGGGLKQTGRTENRSRRTNVAACGNPRRSKGQLAQADREREQRLLPPEEPRGLQDRVQIADRVLLLTDRPLAVEVHHGGADVVQGDLRFEGAPHRFLRGGLLFS